MTMMAAAVVMVVVMTLTATMVVMTTVTTTAMSMNEPFFFLCGFVLMGDVLKEKRACEFWEFAALCTGWVFRGVRGGVL